MFGKKERTLLFANNLWYLSEGMLGPLFGIFCQRFNSSPLDISWVWSLYLISVGIVVIGLGYISDFIHKEKLLVAGYALQTILTFCYIFITSKKQLALLQIGLGISGGLSTTTWYALYARYEDKTHEGLTWGLANGLSSIYTGIALLCGGLILANASFDVLFIIMGCIQFLATIYVSKLVFIERPKIIRRFRNPGLAKN
ncbi:MFS transporter [Legionella sp. PATHC032]|uniref:MFS transporter n=1 Tax=Legionella sp. PATHC032 TaxID=2992039 RepID=UPI001B1BD2A6|nr:MFS transporter [Legionella sp. PATHC032]MCW8421545.1 MFS transporter [Legionella sp. PATHC032]HAZ7572517.1 MFS transporter [Legionella pneumophila]HBA1633871.1 MFS transporter [Legionella pneumophila]